MTARRGQHTGRRAWRPAAGRCKFWQQRILATLYSLVHIWPPSVNLAQRESGHASAFPGSAVQRWRQRVGM